MRSQGFLFFLGGLGVVDCLLVVLDLFFLSRRRTVFGKVKKGHVLQRATCESAFRVAGVGLCGSQAKVASRFSRVVHEESEKR